MDAIAIYLGVMLAHQNLTRIQVAQQKTEIVRSNNKHSNFPNSTKLNDNKNHKSIDLVVIVTA